MASTRNAYIKRWIRGKISIILYDMWLPWCIENAISEVVNLYWESAYFWWWNVRYCLAYFDEWKNYFWLWSGKHWKTGLMWLATKTLFFWRCARIQGNVQTVIILFWFPKTSFQPVLLFSYSLQAKLFIHYNVFLSILYNVFSAKNCYASSCSVGNYRHVTKISQKILNNNIFRHKIRTVV